MIRRPLPTDDGPARWALIPQIEHARLAGQLAAQWPRRLPDPRLDEDLLWAVDHHDDGWAEWDRQPRLDEEGKPREFREMVTKDSWKIWSDSIDLAEQRSALAAFLVAQHFLRLCADQPEDEPFRQAHHDRCRANLLRWHAQMRIPGPPESSPAMVAHDYLAAFDWLSLLICCGPLESPVELSFPQGTYWLAPQSEGRLSLKPWPLTQPRIELHASGRVVPQASYRDSEQLQAAAVAWQLRAELVDVKER